MYFPSTCVKKSTAGRGLCGPRILYIPKLQKRKSVDWIISWKADSSWHLPPVIGCQSLPPFFASTCLCQGSFSATTVIRTKKRNRLCLEKSWITAVASLPLRLTKILSEEQVSYSNVNEKALSQCGNAIFTVDSLRNQMMAQPCVLPFFLNQKFFVAKKYLTRGESLKNVENHCSDHNEVAIKHFSCPLTTGEVSV